MDFRWIMNRVFKLTIFQCKQCGKKKSVLSITKAEGHYLQVKVAIVIQGDKKDRIYIQ